MKWVERREENSKCCGNEKEGMVLEKEKRKIREVNGWAGRRERRASELVGW